MPASEITQALGALDEITRELREKCPWDREQNERTIVPHTLDEAYELADAVMRGDDAAMLDELGDVLFQVHFLSLLLEERGAGDLGQVAEHCRQKLIRRHPHIYGEVEVSDSAEVLANWDKIKSTEAGREQGIFGEVPTNLPGLLHARKVQRRAAVTGFDPADVETLIDSAQEQLGHLGACVASGDKKAMGDALGDLLFAVVGIARKAKVDPEISLRSASGRFRDRVEQAQALAAEAGHEWEKLEEGDQLAHYAKAVLDGN